MKSYQAVCGANLPSALDGSVRRLFSRYYPSYSTIQMLLESERKAYESMR